MPMTILLLNTSIALLGAGIGAGLVTLAAAFGIGKIGTAALEAIARQPEASNKVQTAMIIAAALIEGVALRHQACAGAAHGSH